MDGGLIILALVLVFVGIFAWQFVVSRNALATTRLESALPPDAVGQLVLGTFTGTLNALWTQGAGPAAINMRRRGKGGGIVMSIDITPLPGGGSAVDMWASTYNEYFLVLANFAGAVTSKKKAIARQLENGAPTTGNSSQSTGLHA